MAQLAPGTVVGGYRVEQIAGRGGMGVVYVATQLALHRRVALKVIAPDLAEDPGFRERFQHESEIAASIDHPNVIPVYEAGEQDGILFLSMRYVDGTDLRALIRSVGRLPAQRTAHIVSQVGAALDAAHVRGLVHRDVKPANILIAAAGNDHAYLTDFGLTKHAASQSGLTKTGTWVGTVDYVAPEQIQGHPVDARTDVYSLGCVLYHSLSGQVPFPRDSEIARIYAHMSEPPPSLRAAVPDAPGEMEAVVQRALAKGPEQRFPSAGDLGRAALAASEGRRAAEPERTVAAGPAAPTAAAVAPQRVATSTGHTAALPPAPPTPPYGAPTPPPGGRRRSRVPLIVAAAVLLLAGAGVAVAFATGAFNTSTNTVVKRLRPAGRTTAAGGPLVRVARVRAVLTEYANAYSNENAAALGSLFAPNIVRRDPSTVTDNRPSALAVYRGQFSQLTSPSYSLANVTIAPGHGEATAQGNYTITAPAHTPATGTIRLHLIRSNGRLLIDEIDLGK